MTIRQDLQKLAKTKYALMDMDGVLYRGDIPLPGLIEFFQFLERNNIRYALLTNNATKSSEEYHQKLLKMGVSVPPELIITSSSATALYLKKIAPEGAGIYVVGMTALRKALFGEDLQDGLFYPDENNPRFVVQGADFNLVYNTVKKACLLIRAGASYIATNADPIFPSEEGLIPGSGSITAMLQTASGQKPFIVGKPEPTMYQLALEVSEASTDEVVMIGDNLITDIKGAAALKIPSILLFSGVTTLEEYEDSPVKADLIFQGLPELENAWQAVL